MHSPEDFLEEGQGIERTLVEELKKIHTREQLLTSVPKLKKLFASLGNVMIAAEEYRAKHRHAFVQTTKREHALSDALRNELTRIYHIEGSRDIIEKCQEETLNRLDAVLKKQAVQRSS